MTLEETLGEVEGLFVGRVVKLCMEGSKTTADVPPNSQQREVR